MLKRTTIVTRLFWGFSLMLLGVLVLGFLGARSVSQLSGLSSDFFRHPFAVSTAILEVRADVLAVQRITGAMVAKTVPGELAALQTQLSRAKSRIDDNMATVRERYMGDAALPAQINKALASWAMSARCSSFPRPRPPSSSNGRRTNAIRPSGSSRSCWR